MRLLHAGHDHFCGCTACAHTKSQRRTNHQPHGRQCVPVWRVRQDRRSCASRGCDSPEPQKCVTLHIERTRSLTNFTSPNLKTLSSSSMIPFHVCRTPSILIAEDFSKFWAEACWSVSQPGMCSPSQRDQQCITHTNCRRRSIPGCTSAK